MEVPNIFIHGIDYHILYFLPAEYVLNMCQVNQQFAAICDDESYWIVKLKYEYPEYIDQKFNELTFKQFYLDLAKNKLKRFPIYSGDQILSHVWLRNTNTEREAGAIIKQLFDLKFPDQEPYFIHVLLNNLKRFDPDNTTAKVLPILREQDVLLDELTPEYDIILWGNTVGFEIIKGKIMIFRTLNYDEVPNYAINLPGIGYQRLTYDPADI